MVRYFLKRLLWMIPIILAVAVIVFTLMCFCPGDPAQIILGSTALESDLEAKREELGLNDPYLVRLADYLTDTFIRFDFGTSWITSVPILDSIKERLPRTITLTLVTAVIAFGLGIPLGITAATHQNKWQDSLSMIAALIGVSIPNFWLALLLVLLFSVKLGWLPVSGVGGIEYYILPAIAGCTGAIAAMARQARSSMLDVIRSDYITTARSKGVPERQVVMKHALKNAMIPIITVMGNQIGRMLGGVMILETIFSIPGMGTFIITGVNNRDYPVVETGSIVLAIVFSLVMLIVDMAYAAVDPRIKAQYTSQSKRKVKENG